MRRCVRYSLILALLPTFHAWAKPSADKKRTVWERATQPNGEHVDELLRRGSALVVEDNPNAALSMLEDAVKLEPDAPDGHYWLANAFLKLRRYGECRDELLEIRRIAPEYTPPGAAGSAMVDFSLAVCLAMSGKVLESITEYQRVLSAGGGSLEPALLHWNLGDSFQALGRLDEAIAEYRRGLEIQPRHAMLHFALAVAYDRNEEGARAEEEMAEGLSLDASPTLTKMDPPTLFVPPEDEDYYRGLAHALAGRRAQAIVHFRRYSSRMPSSPWKRLITKHLERLGEGKLRREDLSVRGGHLSETVTRSLVSMAPRLQDCLGGDLLALASVKLSFIGGSEDAARVQHGRAVGPQVQIFSDQPGTIPPISEDAIRCLRIRLDEARLPARTEQPTTVMFSIIGGE